MFFFHDGVAFLWPSHAFVCHGWTATFKTGTSVVVTCLHLIRLQSILSISLKAADGQLILNLR